jgi:transcriptional regulator with XRE-family HTH domain
MEDQRTGAALRALRLRRNLRQSDLAKAAGVSAPTISRMERGHLGKLSLATIRSVAAALDMRLDVVPRWRGGDLDRLLNARHSAMHEAVARMFEGMPGWSFAAEVSFAVYAERGVVDVLAWHAATRTLLVVELKTELVDVQEVLGTLDRKRRLAPTISRDRGWAPAQVGVWLLLAESTTNRDRVRAHQAVLRGAYPAGGIEIRRWLAAPAGPIRALSFLAAPAGGGVGGAAAGRGCEAGDGAGIAGPRHGVGASGLRNGHGGNAISPFAPRKRVRLPRAGKGTDARRQSVADSCVAGIGQEAESARGRAEKRLDPGIDEAPAG